MNLAKEELELSVIYNEALRWNNLNSRMKTMADWCDALLVNHPLRRKVRKQLALARQADLVFVRGLHRGSHESLLSWQRGELVKTYLWDSLSFSNDLTALGRALPIVEVDREQHGRVYPHMFIQVPVSQELTIVLSNNLRYVVRVELVFPRWINERWAKMYLGNSVKTVLIPVRWLRSDVMKLRDLFVSAKVTVLNACLLETSYLRRPDNGGFVTVSEAYREYNAEFDQLPWYQRMFKTRWSIDEFEKEKENLLIDPREYMVDDERVRKLLKDSSGYQKELLNNRDLISCIHGLQALFTAVYVQKLEYPAVNFREKVLL